MRVAVVTIAARNYFALARSLLAGIAEFEPDIDRFVFVTDDLERAEVCEEGRVLTPADIFGDDAYRKLAHGYDIVELATAVKPVVMRHLLERGFERVLYFDPDIQVFGTLDALIEPLDDDDIVLTPHTTEPVPLDGKIPSELSLLRRGSYNLGFIGVANRPSAFTMLDWCSERLERYCLNDVQFGLFVDQKWMDLVPALFARTAILRNRGCNVAYWNLHARKLEAGDPPRLASGEALIFFHFSGFDPRKPGRFTTYQNRFVLADEPVLQRLLAGYAQRVCAYGHLERLALGYGLARFSLRSSIRRFARHVYWQARHVMYGPFPRD